MIRVHSSEDRMILQVTRLLTSIRICLSLTDEVHWRGAIVQIFDDGINGIILENFFVPNPMQEVVEVMIPGYYQHLEIITLHDFQ